MKPLRALASSLLASVPFGGLSSAQAPAALPAAALPVREVTVFKDGHAYVLREAPLAADANGELVLTELPVPVLGTFWPYATGGARLVSATAGRDKVADDVRAVDLRQIARANVGKDVVVGTEQERIDGRLLDVPVREPAGEGGGELLVVATAGGTRVLPLKNVRDLEVRGEFAATLRTEQQRERLRLRTTGGGAGATVGVVYVQNGLRWIPSYRVDVDGKGKARVQLEATLVDDLIDLDAAVVHLVIGVPKFEFEGLVDPISLQQEVAQVAANARAASQTANFLSNALRTQTAGFVADEVAPAEPTVEGGAGNEDLFVFTLRDVTLKKGERMVLPLASFTLDYRDVYVLDVPLAPPLDVREGLQDQRALELLRELAAPKARHVLRLKNVGETPLTTAPALVLRDGKVLAQGRIRYAPVGTETDLEINVAIDVGVDVDEHETSRTPGAIRENRDEYTRVDLAGAIELRNDKAERIELEVTRRVLGLVDSVGQGGAKRQLDFVRMWGDGRVPGWWTWWSWPYWWFRHNGFGELRWRLELAPGEAAKLEGSWHYFWR